MTTPFRWWLTWCGSLSVRRPVLLSQVGTARELAALRRSQQFCSSSNMETSVKDGMHAV